MKSTHLKTLSAAFTLAMPLLFTNAAAKEPVEKVRPPPISKELLAKFEHYNLRPTSATEGPCIEYSVHDASGTKFISIGFLKGLSEFLCAKGPFPTGVPCEEWRNSMTSCEENAPIDWRKRKEPDGTTRILELK